jgi:hypothetical protein
MPGPVNPETDARPTLEQLLASFDPKKHGGEVISGVAVGAEVFSNGDS